MVARPGQDLLIQAYSGLVAVTGQLDERPTRGRPRRGRPAWRGDLRARHRRRLRQEAQDRPGHAGRGEPAQCRARSADRAAHDLSDPPAAVADGRRLMSRNENLATWFHEAPYGIYRCADAWLALSINDTAKLAARSAASELAALAGLRPLRRARPAGRGGRRGARRAQLRRAGRGLRCARRSGTSGCTSTTTCRTTRRSATTRCSARCRWGAAARSWSTTRTATTARCRRSAIWRSRSAPTAARCWTSSAMAPDEIEALLASGAIHGPGRGGARRHA